MLGGTLRRAARACPASRGCAPPPLRGAPTLRVTPHDSPVVTREIGVLLQELVERAVEVEDGLLLAQRPDARRHLADELLVVGDDEGGALVAREPLAER